MRRGAAALAAAWVFACAPEPESAGPPFTITGVYADERTQVIIDDDLNAYVRNVVVPATYDAAGHCHRVSFDLPDASFTGCLGARALVGAFHHRNGTVERVYLVRKP